MLRSGASMVASFEESVINGVGRRCRVRPTGVLCGALLVYLASCGGPKRPAGGATPVYISEASPDAGSSADATGGTAGRCESLGASKGSVEVGMVGIPSGAFVF